MCDLPHHSSINRFLKLNNTTIHWKLPGEFIIDEVTGRIYAQRTLDREARAVWRFVVLATDEGGEGLTGFTDVIINVWDINDNAPIFACAPDSCHGDVSENSPPGTSVMEMTATDLDDAAVGQNAMLAYRIVGNAALNGANSGADVFSINPATGAVSVAMSGLDREQTDSYVLVVEARDGGGMIGTATATIHVTDVNDHVPRFLDRTCSIRIPESSEPNTPIIELAAEDADAGENGQLTFSVVAGDPEQKFYMVSHRQEQRGTLRLKKHLDYERPGEQRFNLTIKVEDMQYSSLLHCTLEIEDCNDHVPVFIPHFIQLPAVREDVAPGTSVASVAASDLDSGFNREITYSIASESDLYHLFSVDQSGLVTVASELDREKVALHHLVILATDHGTPPLTGTATIQMALLDVNDNGPEFEAAYAPIVWENVLGPQVVRLNQSSTLLKAVDRDSEENGSPFSFSVPLEYRYSNDFHLQDNGNDTATITALRAFDRERQKEFLLPVIMTDRGSPPKTVTNTLTITIGDENDHAHIAGQKKVFINCHRGNGFNNINIRSLAIHHHPPSQQQQQHFCQPDPPSRAGTATTTSSISSGTATIRRDVPPCRSPAQGQTANPSRAAQLARKSLSFSSQDLARYLCEIIRDADQHPETAPFDSLQVFSTEGGGSLAGSLSSFSSAGLEEGTAAGHECLKEWGPRFEKLKALYDANPRHSKLWS
uniref:Cadherin domain-containing protein n=1 Tax=Sinocyclocheilus rhinocerous TaxID=307959 RepID=A0A673H372_9TELE